MKATSAGPTESPLGPPLDGRPSATVVRAPVAGSTLLMRPVRPVVPASGDSPSMVPPVPASAT